MSRRFTSLLLLVLLLPLGACGPDGAAGASGDEDRTPVARTGAHTLTVSELVALLEDRDELPNDREVVRAVADLWLDHVLLARASRSDARLESIDLSRIVQDQLDEQMVLALRDSVIRVDTAFTDDELRRLFEQQASDAEIRARHILLDFPDAPTEAERDSVRELALELRQRAADGEDFGELARQYSDDSGSADRGGDLGRFGRGEMVPSFEEAAFALEPGTVSEPVESPYGLHLIRVEERDAPNFEENRERFERQVRSRRVAEAESTYVSQLEDSVDPRIVPDAHPVVRQLASRPDTRLPPRAARRPLVEYEGGALTAAEYLDFVQGRPLAQRRQLESAASQQIDALLESLVRRELLLAEARASGLEPPEERRDSVRAQIAGQLDRILGQMGVAEIAPREDETPEEAVDRRARELVAEIIDGDRQVMPLGSLAYTLRRDLEAEVFEPALDRVAQRLEDAEADTAAAETPVRSGAAAGAEAPPAAETATDSSP